MDTHIHFRFTSLCAILTPTLTLCTFSSSSRFPDRHWSTVDELLLPETAPDSGVYVYEQEEQEEGGGGRGHGHGRSFGPKAPLWRHGPTVGRRDSFYCTHISGCQRLKNGNTLSEWSSYMNKDANRNYL